MLSQRFTVDSAHGGDPIRLSSTPIKSLSPRNSATFYKDIDRNTTAVSTTNTTDLPDRRNNLYNHDHNKHNNQNSHNSHSHSHNDHDHDNHDNYNNSTNNHNQTTKNVQKNYFQSFSMDHKALFDELQRDISAKALEVEELKCELNESEAENDTLRSEIAKLRHDNQHLLRTIQEKDAYQCKMRKQLDIVTEVAYAMYGKICAVKQRFYEGQQKNAWLAESCADEK